MRGTARKTPVAVSPPQRKNASAGTESAARTNKKAAPGPTKATPSGRNGGKDRLSRADWIDAGEVILCQSGITGVKLAALTDRLKVSIGSFYHHFSSFEHYLGDLADNYSVERVRHELDIARAEGLSPLDRIQRLRTVSTQLGTFDLDRAMRVWATMDERAEKNLRRAETLVLSYLEEAFDEMGFDRSASALRARILLSVNVVNLGESDAKTHEDYLKKVLQLVSRPGG